MLKQMDLVAAAVNFQQASLMSKVQYAVAGKMLSAQKQAGAAVIQLIDAAGANVNKAGDAMVAAATGLGGSIDVTG